MEFRTGEPVQHARIGLPPPPPGRDGRRHDDGAMPVRLVFTPHGCGPGGAAREW